MTDFSGQTNLEYYPSGVIKSYVTLVDDEFLIAGQFIKVAEGTEVTFHQNGEIKSLYLGDKAIFKIGCVTLAFQKNDRVDFNEDGRLKADVRPYRNSKKPQPGVFQEIITAAFQLFKI